MASEWETAEKAEWRLAEKFVVDEEDGFAWLSVGKDLRAHPKATGHWERLPFLGLKKGDIFRLWEPKGGPDHVVEGKHDVCVALEDAHTPEGGVPTLETLHVNGMIPYP